MATANLFLSSIFAGGAVMLGLCSIIPEGKDANQRVWIAVGSGVFTFFAVFLHGLI